MPPNAVPQWLWANLRARAASVSSGTVGCDALWRREPGTADTGPRLAPVCVARQRGRFRRASAPKSGNVIGDAGRDAPADDALDGRGGTPGQARSEQASERLLRRQVVVDLDWTVTGRSARCDECCIAREVRTGSPRGNPRSRRHWQPHGRTLTWPRLRVRPDTA